MENEQDLVIPDTKWKAPETEENIKEKVAERLTQTFSSRLSEYLTGMKPEDPAMLERLSSDQEIIRAKYNLPTWGLPPAEFERSLMQIAHSLGVRIQPKSECGKFFEENPFAGAVHFGDGKIGIDIDRADINTYLKSLGVLEHELIHAIQNHKSRSMPIELMEYEAYVSGANIEYLKNNPDAINAILFNFLIGSSVNIYYKLESEERGEKVAPVWNNPEYFLKKDGIEFDSIEADIKHELEES